MKVALGIVLVECFLIYKAAHKDTHKFPFRKIISRKSDRRGGSENTTARPSGVLPGLFGCIVGVRLAPIALTATFNPVIVTQIPRGLGGSRHPQTACRYDTRRQAQFYYFLYIHYRYYLHYRARPRLREREDKASADTTNKP